MNPLPWTHDARADADTTSVRLGMCWRQPLMLTVVLAATPSTLWLPAFGGRTIRRSPLVAGAAEQQASAATEPRGSAR